MEKFDGVVIGAGHNGLTLAAYLARAGLKIAVVERNPHIGGGCTTEEPALPGYRFNLHSNFFMGLRHSPLIREIGRAIFDCKITPLDIATILEALPNGADPSII